MFTPLHDKCENCDNNHSLILSALQLMQPPLFSNAREVNAAIQDVEALVGVSRAGLGVTCAPRGAVSGALYIRDSPMGAWQDCRTCGELFHCMA